MPSARRLASVYLSRSIPLRTRFDLLRAAAARRLRPRPAYGVRYGPGQVFLSHDDYEIDWKSLTFVVADHSYPGGYRGAYVLDVGAHKGYYGAYAIANGATHVVSFEPETANVRLLEDAAASYRRSGVEWQIRQAAIGAERGEAELHVMGASWGHALHPPEHFAEYEVGREQVTVEAMSDVLAQAETHADARAVVVKINVEGEECAIVLGTPLERWHVASELFVEVHPWSECTGGELAAHLAGAGFRELLRPAAPILRLRREESSRSGPRNAPS